MRPPPHPCPSFASAHLGICPMSCVLQVYSCLIAHGHWGLMVKSAKAQHSADPTRALTPCEHTQLHRYRARVSKFLQAERWWKHTLAPAS